MISDSATKGLLLALTSSLILSGCASNSYPVAIDKKAISPVTYEFSVDGIDKETLFVRARDHVATVYGDSRSVVRVQDPHEGLILGKGSISWDLETGSFMIPYISCSSMYDVRFIAKDEKARLQLELLEGAPAFSQCKGWPLPTISAYKKIKLSFDDIATGFENALNGTSALSSFKDF